MDELTMSEIGIEAHGFVLSATVVLLRLIALLFPDLQPLKSTINAMQMTKQKRFILFTHNTQHSAAFKAAQQHTMLPRLDVDSTR